MQTHVGGWLSKAKESVVLLKVFSEVYDLGSMLNDRKIYDHVLSRFPETEYDRVSFLAYRNLKKDPLAKG